MNLIEIQRGLRQVVMALMFWAIDVPRKLLQSDAILSSEVELIIKKSYSYYTYVGLSPEIRGHEEGIPSNR